ncbi:MAG: HlyD family efflux transporter periplasmic adaptor subunit [Myxococcales bacterium]|nr:HlyD family efflux transporter periplasmic adaptor subunit [Myxococcales bacterium]MCB9668443.1 HlyD family efflux transporter periplasmic adaptor subunit [Alphaproteobacteria bacterium]MCB9690681.1 HlyD family efflux transporter periplasmic adaptor subunit [Alphaproteobacteria bacterium]
MIGIRNRRRLGALVWGLGVVVAVGWSSVQSRDQGAVPGLGRERVVQIASEIDGRVDAVEVELHDDVHAGEVVVRMAPTHLELEREIAAAELLAIAQAPTVDPEQAVERARDQARVKQLQGESEAVAGRIRSLRRLVEGGAASQAELDEALAREEELRLKLARARPDPVDAPSSAWSVVAALRRLDAVEARLEGLSLRSTIDGRVAAVHRLPGEVVRKGEPVVTVERETSEEVIAWVAPQRVPEPGAAAVVQRSDGTRVKGEVVSVSPGSAVLPEQIWTMPGRPQYGIPVRVRLSGASIRPREPVRVFL